MRRGRRAAPARGGRQVGGGGALEAVAERIELRVEIGHRVISMEKSACEGCSGRARRARGRPGAWSPAARRPRRSRGPRRPAGGSPAAGRSGRWASASSRPSSQVSSGSGSGSRSMPSSTPRRSQALRLEPPLTHAHEQDVAGDPEQPGAGRAARLVAEARAREPRLGERLGGQVVRGVRILGCAAGDSRRCARRSARRARGTRPRRSARPRAARRRSSFAQLDSRHVLSVRR